MRLVVCLCLLGASAAWWEVPHELTAEVARLTLVGGSAQQVQAFDRALQLVNVLAPYYPEDADWMNAAVWADDIKRDDKRFSNWHFIDIPYLVNVTSAPEPDSVDTLVWACDLIFKQLSTGSYVPNFDNGKATGIRFFLHFLGDLHQPLHCSTRVTPADPGGDYGGNDFFIVDPIDGIDELHAYWDNAGGIFNGILRNQTNKLTATATALIESHPAASLEEFIPGECNFTKWAYESYDAAVNVVYQGIAENEEPTAAYRNKTQQLASRRVVLGGLRLAACLNIAMTAGGSFDGNPSNKGNTVSMATFGGVVGALAVLVVVALVMAFAFKRRAASTRMWQPDGDESRVGLTSYNVADDGDNKGAAAV